MKTKLLCISMFWISIVCFSQNTYVPDDNFEQVLIDLGYDTAPLDDYVPTANIITVSELDIESMNISDLTGVEDFAALTYINCASNNLSSLNVSQNTALNYIYCYNNSISTLVVSQNTALTILDCTGNLISNLDVSQNGLLDILHCAYNNLSNLNVKNGNNISFTDFDASNNPSLTCINVDDAAWSTTNWINIDAQTSFSEDCSAMSVDDFSFSGINIYPNPVIDKLTVSINEEAIYSLINLNGQILKSGEISQKENTVVVSNLSTGLYFVKVKTEKGTITKKLIKQ